MTSNNIYGGRTLIIAIIIAALVAMAGGAGAATITVDDSGGADYTRIQDAVVNPSAELFVSALVEGVRFTAKSSGTYRFTNIVVATPTPMPTSSPTFGLTDIGQRIGQINEGVASIASGDVNNDGYIDLVLASNESGTIIQLYLNDGTGNFTKTDDIFPVTANHNPLWNFGIVIRDFNRDGLLDIATADAWRGVNVYMQANNGSFNWSQAILVPEVNEVKGIDAADVDHDGDDDIVFGGHNGIPDRGDRIYLNDGTGHFSDSGQRIGSDVTWDTVFGDMDNNGDIDYISINRYRENTAKIHINNGAGIFDKTIDIPTTQSDDSYDVKLADLNNDGLLDIVIANSIDINNGTTSKIFMNKGNFNFELTDDKLGTQNSETKGIDIVDIDNDGHYDVVLGNYNIANMIYRNNGTGNFAKMDTGILANHTTSIAAGDFNNDGFTDVVIGDVSDLSGGYYRIYLNDGRGLQKNLPSAPPAMLWSRINGNNANLSWGYGYNQTTSTNSSFTYNIRIGTQPRKNDIVSGTSPNGKGYLENSSYYIKGLKEGTYYWSVQTVDAGFNKSVFSHEEQFAIFEVPTSTTTPPPTPTQTVGNIVSRYAGIDGIVQKSEAVQAVMDYLSGVITKQEAVDVVMAYFNG